MSCSPNSFNRWDAIPYPGKCLPTFGDMPAGGSWPLVYFKRDASGGFTDLKGSPVSFDIKTPEASFDFQGVQLEAVLDAAANLTDAQKQQAIYWGAGAPANQFFPIIQYIMNAYKVPFVKQNRILSILFSAIQDAFILCWNYKYKFQIPRPVQYDQSFQSFLPTPQHPSYPSGHSVYAGCFEVIVSYFFPGQAYNLQQITKECSLSRLYAGVHYPIDLSEGIKLGKDVAAKVLAQIEPAFDAYGTNVDFIYPEILDVKFPPPPYTQLFFPS